MPKIRIAREDIETSRGVGTIGIICDCQPLEAVMNGRIELKRADLDEAGEKITNIIVGWVENGWHLGPNPGNLVQWRPREWNQEADRLANNEMNERTGGTTWFANPDVFDWANWDIRLYGDGGTRGGKGRGIGGIGWHIIGIKEGRVIKIGGGGNYQAKVRGEGTDSFEMEMRAMEEGTRILNRHIGGSKKGKPGRGTGGKREYAPIEVGEMDWEGREWEGNEGESRRNNLE